VLGDLVNTPEPAATRLPRDGRRRADAAIERQLENDCRGDCSRSSLAGELSTSDEESRTDIADANLEELAFALLSALQGGA